MASGEDDRWDGPRKRSCLAVVAALMAAVGREVAANARPGGAATAEPATQSGVAERGE